MEKRKDKGGKAVSSCSCEICLLHPHLKGALRRMRPPELRLFSRAELLLLLERDICSAGDTNSKFQVGSDACWWHLCAADPTFPFYLIPTKEFVYSLASYLARRVQELRSEGHRRGARSCCTTAGVAAACSKSCSSSCCCSTWDTTRPVRILECGAGTGLLAAHLLPLLQKLLQADQPQDTSATYLPQQHKRRQKQQQTPERQGEHRSSEEGSAGLDGQESGVGAAAYTPCITHDDETVAAERGDAPMFAYIASEPRQELQWCPLGLVPTRTGCRSAMLQQCPQLVICCWMPFNVDWTQDARSSCCACCRAILHGGGKGNTSQQQRGCACHVQEYILIGHAEGGLVGRPLETWGLHCPNAALLPCGVDYENPQEAPVQCRSHSASPEAVTNCPPSASSTGIKTTSQQDEGGRKRRRSSSNGEALAAVQWQSANTFRSITPTVRVAVETSPGADEDATDDECAAAAEREEAGEFGGMRLMPLKDRPYYREGFVRLPPLPGQGESRPPKPQRPEDEGMVEELQGLWSLSRFDSLHSLRQGCPPVSRVVVFRRTEHRANL